MTERQIKLTAGALLHDIGKVIYRSGDGRSHSESGYEYLKNTVHLEDKDILDCVRFHHGCNLRKASIKEDALAYIVYFADNIAAAADRREKEAGEYGFDKSVPLASIFNILNGNKEEKHYRLQKLDPALGINYPCEESVSNAESFYQQIIPEITDHLKGISLDSAYLNSLLTVLEADLTYVPSSTAKKELSDISLYDHLKLTAALSLCIEAYVNEAKISDLKSYLCTSAEKAYQEEMFLLYSMDMSGIQSFIYTISSEGALKALRARSFYLEFLMEHLIDELLDNLELTRTNLIYSGGGHSYLLLPNTKSVKEKLKKFEAEQNAWLLDQFDIDLYLAGGKAACSANTLKNEPEGSYPELFRQISAELSGKKTHRYSADEIRHLNGKPQEGKRECRVCRRMGKIDEVGRCPFCGSLNQLSRQVLNGTFFAVVNEKEGQNEGIRLPGGKKLIAFSSEEEASLRSCMQSEQYVRCYTKNTFYSGKLLSTHLWVGDYATKDTFDEFAQAAQGISRIGVLRADVDNLGKTFADGFRRDGSTKYMTLSRTAALSRQLSLFFKAHINALLKSGKVSILRGGKEKKAAIVYSGGDDIFLVGAWNEVIEAFTELHESFQRYAQGTLSISGGVGLYSSGYPINVMAKEVECLEEEAKNSPGKNAVTLFEKYGCFSWNVFLKEVIGTKLKAIEAFFDSDAGEYGKAFLYHLVELMRNVDEKINLARFVYLLSRMEPDEKASEGAKRAYQVFSEQMYQWMQDDEARRVCVAAMYLYVYLTREKENENGSLAERKLS